MTGKTTQYRTTEEEVILTRLLEKAIRRSEAVDREALCVVAGEKVRRLACSVFTSCSAVSSQADTHVTYQPTTLCHHPLSRIRPLSENISLPHLYL